MRRASALALALWAAAAAQGAELCGRVGVLGRPLPEGFVTLLPDARPWRGDDALGGGRPHPGATRRSLVRFSGGRFCLAQPAAGNYGLWVSPLGLWEPMAAAYSGLDKGPDGYRLSVSSSGAFALYGADGRAAAPDGLGLDFAAAKPESDWTRMRVSLAASGPGPDWARAPALVLLHLQFLGYVFHWVDDPAAAAGFELPVKPWKLVDSLVAAPGWAVAGTEPVFHERYSDSVIFKPAEARPFRLDLRPAAEVEGAVTRADGSPFKPFLDPGGARGELFGFFVSNLEGTEEFHAYADESGSFHFAASEGLWQVQPIFERGDGFSVRTGPQTLAWLRAGTKTRLDYVLPDRARIRLRHQSTPLATFWEQQYSLYPRRDHWALAFPSGALDPADSHQLLIREEAVFALAQRPNGRWRVSEGSGAAADEDEWLDVPVGRYDVYLLEIDRRSPPVSRVLALSKGLLLKKGERRDVSFAKADFLPRGSARLEGSVALSMKAGWPDLYAVRSVRRMQLMFAPHVNLYDASGRLVAAAFADINEAEFRKIFAAIDGHDLSPVGPLLFARPRPFELRDLPAGRYRAELVAFGYPTRTREVELKEGEAARWDVDLDKDK